MEGDFTSIQERPLSLPATLGRRRIISLTMEGDFTSIQERPLSLPPSLVRLELNGSRGELGPAPAGLRRLRLRAYRYGKDDAEIPRPLLRDLDDGDAVQCFLRELTQIIGALLPNLTHLVLEGVLQDDSGDLTSLRSCIQMLIQLPHPHLQDVVIDCWKLRWEDLLPLLSPAAMRLSVQGCLFASAVVSEMFTVPPLPKGLTSLVVEGCYCDSARLVFSRIPDSLRRLTIWMSPTEVRFQQPLPRGLTSLTGDDSVGGSALPAGLRELQLVGSPQLEHVPPGLRALKLRDYEHPLPQLPDTLETLVLYDCMHYADSVPDSVRLLSLYWQPPQPAPPLPARWPTHLERLVYWGKSAVAEPPRIAHLPRTLRQLELNGCEVHARLPQTLQRVRLGREFRQEVEFTGKVVVNSRQTYFDEYDD